MKASKGRTGRRVSPSVNSECCLDPEIRWGGTPCLCNCHYPALSVKQMFENREQFKIKEADNG